MRWLVGMGRLLADRGVGTYTETTYADDAAWPLFFAYQPSEPPECLVLTSYDGEDVQSGQEYDEPRMQVRARSPHPLAGGEILQDVYDELNGLGRTTLPNGVEVQDVIGLNSGPNYLGRDDREWHQYSVNFTVSVKNEVRQERLEGI